MNSEQLADTWSHIVSKAMRDDAFKQRLVSEPSLVLKEQGIYVPEGMRLRVVENTDEVLHFTLPAKPQSDELSEAELECVAGGALSPSLVGDLAAVFGWNGDQIHQIGNAAGWKTGGSNSGNLRSPPTGNA